MEDIGAYMGEFKVIFFATIKCGICVLFFYKQLGNICNFNIKRLKIIKQMSPR